MTDHWQIPAVDMVDPYTIAVGDTIRLLPDAPATDRLVLGIDTGPLGVRYTLTGDRDYTVHHGGAVARVRTGGTP